MGKLLPGIAVEQLPEGRGKDAPCVDDGHAHGVQVHNLLRVFVHADLAPYPPGYHAERDQGAADHVEVLGQPPEGNVHILITLGENIHRRFVMAVILRTYPEINDRHV